MGRVVLFWGGNTFSNHKICHGTHSWDWNLSHFLYSGNQLSICMAGSQICLLGVQCSMQQKMELRISCHEERQILNNYVLHQQRPSYFWIEHVWKSSGRSFTCHLFDKCARYLSSCTRKHSIIADESLTDGNRISCILKINLRVVLYLELNSICTDENAITWDGK